MNQKSRNRVIRRVVLFCLAAALVPIVAGCGGGNLCCGSDSGNGNVDVNIRSARQTTDANQPGAPR